jgi:hypothetical protein
LQARASQRTDRRHRVAPPWAVPGRPGRYARLELGGFAQPRERLFRSPGIEIDLGGEAEV